MTRVTIVCGQCNVRPVHIRRKGQLKCDSLCRPCANANRALQRYWCLPDVNMPLRWAEPRERMQLMTTRSVAAIGRMTVL